MASKLLNVLEDVEKGRQNCVKNAKLANLAAADNMSVYDLGNLFLEQNNPEYIVPLPWERPNDWWDIFTILDEAENRVDDENNIVYPAYIILFDDEQLITTFSKTADKQALQGDSYLTSDGVWYGVPEAAHTWDLSKDKSTLAGYKTRYVIVYVKDPNNIGIVNIRSYPCLEIYTHANTIFGGFVPGDYASPYNATLMDVVFNDASNFSSGSPYINFQDCTRLRRVIMNSITTIPASAFRWSGLAIFEASNVTIVNGDAFRQTKIDKVNFPKVKSIGNNAFTDISSLKYAYLPEVTNIGDSAFSGCNGLINIDASKVSIIGSSAFYNCTALKSVVFPDAIQIGSSAFSGCYSLCSMILSSVTNIGAQAFRSCISLTGLDLPNVTTIGDSCFLGCTSLRSLSFPKIQIIQSSFLTYTYSLLSLDIPSSLISWSTPLVGVTPSDLRFINLPNNFKLSMDFSACYRLTYSSLIDIISKLADVTEEQGTYTLTLGATNLAKLTAEEIAVGTNKGWVIN